MSARILPWLLALTVPVTVGALWKVRRDYREKGRVTVLGLLGACLMLFVPNLMLDYATTYQMPTTALDFVGIAVGTLGLALCLVSVFFFRSPMKVLCLDVGTLTVSGPYRWSRNPQYVGWILFLLGFSLNDWSLWCLAALVVVAIGLHLLVLIEEEHLRRIFGEPYAEFCRRIPRYLGWPAAAGPAATP